MPNSLVPTPHVAPHVTPHVALAAKPDLSPATQIASIQPSRVISDVGQDLRTIWYFEQSAVNRKRTCAYICHARGASTFTMAYHPLDRNDQIVADLPLERLPAAIDDLLAAGFGKRAAPLSTLKPPTDRHSALTRDMERLQLPRASPLCLAPPDTHVAQSPSSSGAF